MWRVADLQGHRNPFSKELLELNVGQLDFILEMYAKDHPKEVTFTRAGKGEERTRHTSAMASWANVLTGGALKRFLAPQINFAAVEARKKQAEARQPVLRGAALDAENND